MDCSLNGGNSALDVRQGGIAAIMPMNKPPLDELLKVSSNRYILAIVAAKYARVVTDQANAGVLDDTVKPVSKALEEIANRRVKYTMPGKGLK